VGAIGSSYKFNVVTESGLKKKKICKIISHIARDPSKAAFTHISQIYTRRIAESGMVAEGGQLKCTVSHTARNIDTIYLMEIVLCSV